MNNQLIRKSRNDSSRGNPAGSECTDSFKRLAFEVCLDGKMFVVAFNPGETALDIEIPWQPAVQTGALGPDAIRETKTVRPRSVALFRQ